MPKLKVLSGTDIIDILHQFGFVVVSQRGSHIKLRREVNGKRQTLTIPLHDSVDRGTIKAIYNQVLQYVLDHDLKPFFYTE